MESTVVASAVTTFLLDRLTREHKEEP